MPTLIFSSTGHDELELGLARLEEPPGLDGDGAPSATVTAGGSTAVMSSATVDPTADLSLIVCRLDDSLKIVQSGYLWRLSRSGSVGASDLATAGGQHPPPMLRAQSVGASTTRWTRRWFALRADSCLYFFKTENVRWGKGHKEF